MSIEVKLPSLGEGVASGDVLEIFVKEGDTISKDQSLLELETDKATVSVPSPTAGKILKIVVKEGETVAVGAPIVVVESSSAPTAAPAPTPAPVKQEAPKVEPPTLTPVVEAKPAAAAPVVAAPVAPRPAPTPVVAPQIAAQPPVLAPVATSLDNASDVIPAGPAIRRFAREVGVDLTGVVGTGEGGRITREDVLAVVRQASQSVRTAAPSVSNASTASSTASVDPSLHDEHGPIHVEKLTKIRKTIAAQMHKSWSTVPRVVNFDDADVTELEAFRQTSKDDYAARGIKLTTMPFLIKAVATALRHHPAINATIDLENEQIIYKEYVNIGIAVDSDRGLVVPVLKNADKLPIPDIAQALSTLSGRVRNNDFAVSDLRGGTFTISNLGAIGGTYSTPIVNVPEVAILLVGRSRKLPVVMDDDTIKPRLMMPLSLAYDHRLVDGATAARFLNDVIAYLEAPSRLLLAI